jgi:hypothetical protein
MPTLDSVGSGQSSYDMFVNAAGVQGDILTTPSAGENSAPDWVWDSAGRRTAEGYGSLIEERQWDGTRFTGIGGKYRTSERGFFFKASYIHRF